MKKGVTFFFRKPREGAFSIENLFSIVQQQLQGQIRFHNHYMSCHSSGLKNRLNLLREAAKNHKGLNHVTGDINFITLALPKRKTILTIHDIESLERKGGLASHLLHFFWLVLPVKAAGKITAVSEHTKSKLLQKVSVDPDKIIVIPNPVSGIYHYTPKSFQKEKPRLLQIGTKYNKNLEKLIPAIAGLSCRLTIVGKLSESQVKMLEQHKVDFINKVGLSNEELLQEYQQADIITFASTFEGFGMPIIEANAVGRVVLTSNIGAMAEVAADAAMLVDPLSMEDIRRGIVELIQNDQLREQLIQNGLQNVKKYRPEVIAARYLELYDSMSL
ncbi:glycosyltransferase family 4 protein [Pontibacter qinzhouensis]|uniref:Glycosyltransferase family 4 protein n=1 Tax=Pontibacter qinzhouensis TaxID=2603253 RepID=A0A5C8K7H4_9BACT|nr:glycosyltransferase [Pontibacter qinzhouensis]TXK46976.1 glycosyltransferase family 4 protein [Pontibacter qinzhouensis]